jgi:DNA repair exonuclease SbcCD ATPase subunit
MSVGNQTQAVDFDKEHLTLVLGSNLDLGGDDTGSRNGTGKTTIVNALSYALYGQALTNIRKENLINKINGKAMLVTAEFEKDGFKYRIERGRKPNLLKLYINDQEQENKTTEDEAQGDSRETQKFIDQCLGMSHTMFKHLVALNTYTEPFLSMKAADQREVIEQLLGITLLSEKAEALKLQVKESKDSIQLEQFKIESIKTANENVQKSINSLELKSSAWETKKGADLENLATAIMRLEGVNIEKELADHAALKVWEEQNSQLKDLQKQKATYQTAQAQAEKSVKKYEKEVVALADHKCPQCEQELHDEKHNLLIEESSRSLEDAQNYLASVKANLDSLEERISNIQDIGGRPLTFYDTEAEARDHKNQLAVLENALEAKANEVNPYNEQIEELKHTALQEISWDRVNELTKMRDHQEFLLKLLTNKDSFIRKKIIDQNLTYLNKRLSYYIEKLGLPHTVIFQNDLTVEITHFGQDLDFDNLSRGERNRLILSMSFAFRDVWENLYQSINLLFIDELIDAGLDSAGVEAGLAVLKKMARERNKNIYLISHKEELIGRVNNVLRVVKESGFTSYSNDVDYVDAQ